MFIYYVKIRCEQFEDGNSNMTLVQQPSVGTVASSRPGLRDGPSLSRELWLSSRPTRTSSAGLSR